MNLRKIGVFMLVSTCIFVSACGRNNASMAAVLTSDKSFSEQNYRVKLTEGESSYALTIVVNQGSSGCVTCVISIGVVQSDDTRQVIQTGDSVTITGPSNTLGYQKEKTLDVQLGVGEYVLMVDGKPTPSKITVTK